MINLNNTYKSFRDNHDKDPRFSDIKYLLNTLYDRGCVDRTGTIDFGNGDVITPLPTVKTTDQTLAQVASAKVAEIKTMAETAGKEIFLFWSGGIDSTLVLAAFVAANENLVVGLNDGNKREYPEMYEKIKSGEYSNISWVPTNNFYINELYDEYFCISGELGDQIIGTTNYFKIPREAKELREGLLNDYTTVIPAKYLTDEVNTILGYCPFTITDTADFFWWLNFILKYQSVQTRLPMTHTSDYVDLDTYEHFFEGDLWQQWAMSNRALAKQFIVDNKPRDYKKPYKDYIVSVLNDAGYLTKRKEFGWHGDDIPFLDSIDSVIKSRQAWAVKYDTENAPKL